MSIDNNFLTEAFRRQLSELVTPDVIRAIEAGRSPDALWCGLEETGFTDAMLPEAVGGAELALSASFPLIMAAGEYCVPLPFAETMVARGLLSSQNAPIPKGEPIVIAAPSSFIPGARFARHALVDCEGLPNLVMASATGYDLFATGGATGIEQGEVIATLAADQDAVLLAAAAVAAALMAGAMGRVLEMSLRYAAERQQFGRSLGKFQAIQQQFAVLAEQVLSAQVAARTAFSGSSFEVNRVAAAKCRANEAAAVACNVAHAVHGAIGVTAEFDLQLYTRRLKQWQLSFGSESFWGSRLGQARIASRVATTADFVRLNLGAQHE